MLPWNRTIAALVVGTFACTAPTATHAQVKIPSPPMDGLIERAADYQPLPLPRPSVAEGAARECQAAHPELAWAALPREWREVPLPAMVGQLIMTSFGGDRVSDERVTEAIKAVARSEIGGVIAFRSNVASGAEITAINAAFAAASPELPPFIALDQEGGQVMRLRARDGVPNTPSAAAMGRRSLTTASDAYAAMARALSDKGFNVNFGPVVDLNTNLQNTVVGRTGRTYGDDPTKVTRFGRAFVNAHKDADMLAALKHFPGHGSSTADSHKTPVNITNTWSRRELVPFAKLTKRGGADMVMVGHLRLEDIDPGLPASLSRAAIEGVLRDAMCFTGLVVSDDLSMGAISQRWPIDEAGERFVAAGGDIIMFSGAPAERAPTVAALTGRIVARALQDREFSDRVRWAYARVLHHKLKMADDRKIPRPGPEFVAYAD